MFVLQETIFQKKGRRKLLRAKKRGRKLLLVQRAQRYVERYKYYTVGRVYSIVRYREKVHTLVGRVHYSLYVGLYSTLHSPDGIVPISFHVHLRTPYERVHYSLYVGLYSTLHSPDGIVPISFHVHLRTPLLYSTLSWRYSTYIFPHTFSHALRMKATLSLLRFIIIQAHTHTHTLVYILLLFYNVAHTQVYSRAAGALAQLPWRRDIQSVWRDSWHPRTSRGRVALFQSGESIGIISKWRIHWDRLQEGQSNPAIWLV